jgi:hypothetical protein
MLPACVRLGGSMPLQVLNEHQLQWTRTEFTETLTTAPCRRRLAGGPASASASGGFRGLGTVTRARGGRLPLAVCS